MKQLTNQPVRPVTNQRQGMKESNASLQTARYNSATTACSQGNIRAEMCPSCRKPLPRCAVCFINMGTLSGLIRNKNGSKALVSQNSQKSQVSSKKLTSFDNFFTWCQSCHHGG